MYYLQENFRIWYAAKDFVSNIHGVQLIIIRPDNSVDGVFQMEEFTSGNFQTGCYCYDYIPRGPVGKYLFMICAPQGIKQVSSEIFLEKEVKKPFVRFD